jgi:hypothetical protein
LLNESADGQVTHRLPEGCSGFFDHVFEVGWEPETEPGVPGSGCRDSPREPGL